MPDGCVVQEVDHARCVVKLSSRGHYPNQKTLAPPYINKPADQEQVRCCWLAHFAGVDNYILFPVWWQVSSCDAAVDTVRFELGLKFVQPNENKIT